MRFFLAIFTLLLSANIVSQSIDPETLRSILEEGAEGQAAKSESFESFTQNNYSNTLKLIEDLDLDSERELFFSSLTQSRIQLASQLCAKDSRACFLIDEYRNYKNQLDQPNYDELKLFGIDIFTGYPIELDSFSELPLPDSYKIKVGDVMEVQISGIQEFSSDVAVNASGTINIGTFGSFKVSGLDLNQATQLVSSQIVKTYTGSTVYLGLKSLNPKSVFVLGNVNNPGSYGVNAFATAINALITSGGIKNNSSLRKVAIRNNAKVSYLDLYDFLVFGDPSSDILLNDGDSVLISGLQNKVKIFGEVIRPAIYEFLDGETVSDLLDFSLGFTTEANTKSVFINRLDNMGNARVIEVSSNEFSSFKLANGDEVVINRISGSVNQGVRIVGAIRNPGVYSLAKAEKLGDLINLKTDLLDNTYTPLAIIKRFNFQTRSSYFFKFDLLNSTQLSEIALVDRDEIIILSQQDINFLNSDLVIKRFSPDDPAPMNNLMQIGNFDDASLLKEISKDDNESSSMRSYLSCLENFNIPVKAVSDAIAAKISSLDRRDANKDQANPVPCTKLLSNIPNLIPYLLANSIPVVGNVQNQGLYPISPHVNGMQIYLYAGGSILGNEANLVFEVLYDNVKVVANSSDITQISDLDFINVKLYKSDISEGFVSLYGEVMLPGKYAIRSGETLSSVYKRAGGFTPMAYPLGGILTRESTKKEEQRVLAKAQRDLGEVISNAALNGYLNQNPTDLVQLISLISSLSESEALGRIVTEMDLNLIERSPAKDIVLHNGDEIYIPKINNTVTVVGNVLNPITVPFDPKLKPKDYISIAGGFNNSADKSNTYIIQPNGTSGKINEQFFRLSSAEIYPGSTIIVPRKANSDTFALLRNITPVLANLSVTAASLTAISNN